MLGKNASKVWKAVCRARLFVTDPIDAAERYQIKTV
jgi:hypothetical protein